MATAERIAGGLGIVALLAKVLPGQNTDRVKELQDQGKLVEVSATGSTTHPRWRRPSAARSASLPYQQRSFQASAVILNDDSSV